MKLSVERTNEWIRYAAAAGIYFLVMVAAYINMGQDMGAEYFLPGLIPVIVVLMLLQYGTGVSLFSCGMLGAMVPGLLWCLTFPLLYAWTYHQDWYKSLIYFDFLIGTAQMIALAALGGAFLRLGHRRVTAALLAVLGFLMSLIPLTQIAYYMTVWHALSPASLMALYLTNWHEAGDYIESTVGTLPAIGIGVLLLFFIYLLYRSYLVLARRIYPSAEGSRMGALVAVMVVAAGVLFALVPECSIAGVYKDVTSYVEETQSYGLNQGERYESLIIDLENTLAARAPGTVIFIIGESASRDYMHAYTPGFPYEDTPWLESMASRDGFLIYQNVYSSWTQTVPVLERALTEKSQYNDKEFYESASILDVAKKIGYKTYWFSNQGRYGQFDSAITMVAKTADVAEWTDDSYNFTTKYDESLLPYLTRIDPKANNFVVRLDGDECAVLREQRSLYGSYSRGDLCLCGEESEPARDGLLLRSWGESADLAQSRCVQVRYGAHSHVHLPLTRIPRRDAAPHGDADGAAGCVLYERYDVRYGLRPPRCAEQPLRPAAGFFGVHVRVYA